MWGVSRPFASDTAPKWIDREGLGKRRAGTRRPGKCKSNSKVMWSFFSYNNPRQERNVYSKPFNSERCKWWIPRALSSRENLCCLWLYIMFMAVSDDFSHSTTWPFIFLLNSASKLIARALQPIFHPANKVFSWWIYIVTVNLKSHALAAHERKRERGSGVVMPCHFPTLVCSNAAGFACHSKCSACWQTAEVVARENTLRRHPGNGMSGNVGCFLKLIMYSPINLRSAIAGFIFFLEEKERHIASHADVLEIRLL